MSEIGQKEKYRKYGLIMIVIGFPMLFISKLIGVVLIGGGIITFLTNIERKSK
jgi:hypothetical protein